MENRDRQQRPAGDATQQQSSTASQTHRQTSGRQLSDSLSDVTAHPAANDAGKDVGAGNAAPSDTRRAFRHQAKR